MKVLLRVTVCLVAALAGVLAWGFVGLSDGVNTVEAAAVVGQAMPAYSLPDLDGKIQTLAAHKGKEIVVVVFSNPGCPFSRGAEPALNALSAKFKDQGVVFYAVDSNANVSVEDLKKHAAEAQVPYAILKDADNKYADVVGAKVTPETFVVDKKGVVVYHGAPDDRATPDGAAKNSYLDAALTALCAGKEVEVKEAKTWGCGIKRK